MSTKGFKAVDLGEFEGVPFANDEDTWGNGNPMFGQGLTFYAVEIFNTSNADAASLAVAHRPEKHMSGEPCADGWCGETNNRFSAHVTALGVFRMASAQRASATAAFLP